MSLVQVAQRQYVSLLAFPERQNKELTVSCQTASAVFSLVNDYLISNGKPPLGFLNPLIYAPTSASAFNDITSGSNPGCGTAGFSAERGWDPVRIVQLMRPRNDVPTTTDH